MDMLRSSSTPLFAQLLSKKRRGLQSATFRPEAAADASTLEMAVDHQGKPEKKEWFCMAVCRCSVSYETMPLASVFVFSITETG